MMGANEAATLSALKNLRAEVFGPVFADNAGTIVKSMGDGWLVEFASAVSAVSAAIQVQDRLKNHPTITLRIGVHVGDVTRNEHDIYGDGINIAARLESIAPKGGIMISDAVYSSLDGTLSPSFEAAGAQNLKNIARAVTTWVRNPNSRIGHGEALVAQTPSTLPVLSVHPAANSDERAELQDIADALTADLGTYFGSINWMRSQINNTDTVQGYHLRPILRARGDRLRLETRLQTPAGDTIWTHKSDSSLDDAFDWQDSVVVDIVGHFMAMILEVETTQIAAIPDDELSAEQFMLMGIIAWRGFSLKEFVRSVAFHNRAIQAKPDFAEAYAEGLIVLMAARTMTSNPDLDYYLAKSPAWVEAARPLAAGHPMLGLAISISTYTEDKQLIPLRDAVAQTLRLAPFDARILSFCGWAYLWAGQSQDALACFQKSQDFGPLGPFYVASLGGAAIACIHLGRDEDALAFVEKGLVLSDTYPTYFAAKSAALANLGLLDEAREVMAHYRSLEPQRNIKSWKATNDYGGTQGGKRYLEGLRLAGLPEE